MGANELKGIVDTQNSMISDDEFLKAELSMGIGFHSKEFTALCMRTVEQMKEYDIKTVLDYGSGTGVYAEAYRLRGYDSYAYEIWYAHRKYIRENAPHLKIVEQPITTDLLHFIETAEHMTDEELNNLFAIIKPIYILFSSTSQRTDWDAAWGHINIKTQDEWIRYFNDIGYNIIKELRLPTPYTKLFKYGKD